MPGMAATGASGVCFVVSVCQPSSGRGAGLLSATPAVVHGCALGSPLARRRLCTVASSEGPPRVEDFGARDPYPAEIASNFAERSLGLADTEHRILMPKALK